VNAQTPSGAEIYRIALRFHTPIITGQSTEDGRAFRYLLYGYTEIFEAVG